MIALSTTITAPTLRRRQFERAETVRAMDM
jgi:hypothetical protein